MLTDTTSTTVGCMLNTRTHRGDKDSRANVNIRICRAVVFRCGETGVVHGGHPRVLQRVRANSHERGE